VVGSGVTGAEFASAYNALGAKVTLVSSREMVLPGQDEEAAPSAPGGVHAARRRPPGHGREPRRVRREGDGVHRHAGQPARPSRRRTASWLSVPCRTPRTLASRPRTSPRTGATSRSTGCLVRTHAACTRRATSPGVFALASVAAMQGRIAMWHSIGDAVTPLDLNRVSSNVFTSPEIATGRGDTAAGRGRSVDGRSASWCRCAATPARRCRT